MTVVLVGVGADEDHLRPAPGFDAEGRYEYLPIPESHPTSEKLTYGSWSLEYGDGSASDIIEGLRPRGEDGEWIKDPDAIADHHPHHDPNFDALTYGDRRGGGGKGSTLVSNLEPGDVLGFYNGIRRHEDDDLHRYLYGYMTVAEVHDLSTLEGEEYHDRLRDFPENAHTKRLEGAGEPKHDDLVIVDGTRPGGRLERPVCISERMDEPPWHQVTEEFSTTFETRVRQKGIGRKFPIICEIGAETFIERLEKFQG